MRVARGVVEARELLRRGRTLDLSSVPPQVWARTEEAFGEPMSPSEAVLGGTAPLTTLDGNVRVKIPPGSSTGRRIRLRGRGYPGKGGRRGDLFAEIQVVVPSEPTDEEKKLYAQLAEVSPFDPRD